MKPDTAAYDNELFISVDIEADGPAPGINSMLSLGAVALDVNKHVKGKFSVNIIELPEASADPETVRWWSGFPKAWEACRQAPVEPQEAMLAFNAWIESLRTPETTLTLLAAPTAFDAMFINYYAARCLDRPSWVWNWMDVRSFIAGVKKTGYRKTSKKYWPARWFDKGLPHTHVAADDALETGCAFINILRETIGLKPVKEHYVAVR